MEAVVGILFWLLVLGGAAFWYYKKVQKRRKEEERRALEKAEKKRIEQCGEVVLFFANHLGYIAKECITRNELEELIDSGIEADELANEIWSRIEDKKGIVLGYQSFGEFQQDVKLTQKYRDRHVYLIGKSGSGKTNLLRNMIYQDLLDQKGIGVIAPEAEMINEEILPYIPEERLDDVIYLNPADTQSPVCFNPLQLDQGEDIDLRASENMTIFKRIFHDIGPRMEEILRHSFYTLLEREGTTLLDIERLLDRNDQSFREEVIHDSESPDTVRFWRDVYPNYPKDAHLPVTSRLSRLLRPKTVRNVLCCPYSSFNFREAMDEGKILLFNLSDGILGETNSQLLGQLIVSKFQMATMSRADIPKNERRPFYLYIDEFQTFTGIAGTSYEKILSRARKYRLCLTLAHQQTGQIPNDLLREIFGNVSTMISFNVSFEDASRLAKEFVTEYNGEVVNIPKEEFLRLNVGEAYCKIGRHSFFMNTYLADEFADKVGKASYAIEKSRRNYGIQSKGKALPFEVETKSADSQPLESWKDIDPSEVFK